MNRAAPLDIPRWEWRTFAPSLASLRAFLPGTPEVRCENAHEIRLLCPRSQHDVLVRNNVLRLKWRKQVGPEGLELWDSVIHSTFPLGADVVHRLFEAWGIPVPRLLRPQYSESQFLQEVAPQCPGLCLIHLDICSEAFLIEGAGCHLIEFTTNQGTFACFGIEHEDPGLALQVIRQLGLQSRHNTSYSQGLKAALNISPQH